MVSYSEQMNYSGAPNIMDRFSQIFSRNKRQLKTKNIPPASEGQKLQKKKHLKNPPCHGLSLHIHLINHQNYCWLKKSDWPPGMYKTL